MTQMSFAYDDPNYRRSHGAMFTVVAGVPSLNQVAYTSKQLKSITAVPTTVGTGTTTSGLGIRQITLNGVAIGTLSAPSGTLALVLVQSVATFAANTAAAQNIPIAGGTFTVCVAYPYGGTATSTTTQTGYVFGTGPLGGLSISQGDRIYMQPNGDSSVTFGGEIEYTYTPGTTFTL